MTAAKPDRRMFPGEGTEEDEIEEHGHDNRN